MILLSKKEYEDLVKRAGHVDTLADEKLDALKSQFAKQAMEILQRHDRGWTGVGGFANPLIRDLAALVKHYE